MYDSEDTDDEDEEEAKEVRVTDFGSSLLMGYHFNSSSYIALTSLCQKVVCRRIISLAMV